MLVRVLLFLLILGVGSCSSPTEPERPEDCRLIAGEANPLTGVQNTQTICE